MYGCPLAGELLHDNMRRIQVCLGSDKELSWSVYKHALNNKPLVYKDSNTFPEPGLMVVVGYIQIWKLHLT